MTQSRERILTTHCGSLPRPAGLLELLRARAFYRLSVTAISIEGANPRDEHQWEVFRDHPLPEGRYLIPGVIDTNSTCVERPRLVAQRLLRYAGVVGRGNLVAGTDCGFGRSAPPSSRRKSSTRSWRAWSRGHAWPARSSEAMERRRR